jgi:sugar/nucleoside kinase (ribokinase family)
MATALALGHPFEESGLIASAAGALATTRYGAQTALPRREEVRVLLRKSGRKQAENFLR